MWDLVYSIAFFLGTFFLLLKCNEYEGLVDLFLAPFTICRLTFGRGWYLLVPLILGLGLAMSGFLLAGIIVVIVFNVVFSFSIARVFSDSVLFTIGFGLIILTVPIIGLFALAFVGEYKGYHVSFIWFLTKEGWTH